MRKVISKVASQQIGVEDLRVQAKLGDRVLSDKIIDDVL